MGGNGPGRAWRTSSVATAALLALAAWKPDSLASGLSDGLQLVYVSNGKEGTPNVVDSVRGAGIRDGAVCVSLFQPSPADQRRSAAVHYCVRGDTLFTRDTANGAWITQRPVGARMTIDLVRPNGNRVRYSTDTTSSVTVDGQAFTIVHTTVLTRDSTGRAVRRLTERYSLALLTAVGGRFEVADTTAVTGWRETQVFELRAIHRR